MSSKNLDQKQRTALTYLTALVMVLLILLSGQIGPVVFKYLYLDLQSVTVENHAVGDDPRVTVYRVMKNSFPGRYSTHIKRADDHTYVCSSIYPERLSYSTKANKRQPLITDLEEWFGTRADYDRCQRDPDYGPGRYYLLTCQWRPLPFGFRLSRCLPSAVYERTP